MIEFKERFNYMKDKIGAFRVQSLFLERRTETNQEPIYTLQDQDVDHYVSAKKKYLELKDPTEYYFYKWLVRSKKHWEVLKKSPWFMEHLIQWREELMEKIKADAIKEIINATQLDDEKFMTVKFAASKYITEGKIEESIFGKLSSKEKRKQKDKESKSIKFDDMVDKDAKRLKIV